VALAVAAVAAATAVAHVLGANAASTGFCILIAVLAVAVARGLVAGAAASVAGGLALNYFFLPPVGTFTIAEPENWVALAAFLVTSVLVSHLVAKEKRRAEEAEARRREVEALSAERERFLEERAHLAALRESDALKTSLLRAVSHDLRSPITAIRMGLERLGRGGGKETVGEVARETERLSRRIDNLLAVARLEAGAFAPRPEPFPAADLFRAAREALPHVLSGRDVDVSVASDLPDVWTDPALTVEILTNLLENAVRAAPDGAPILLAASRSPDDGSRVCLEVLDRGPGVPGEIRSSASSATRETGRAGLGLMICRSMAEALGGRVLLLDRPGGGTIARLELPSATPQADT
jgi:two-component system sensor histidine kinase KdpD